MLAITTTRKIRTFLATNGLLRRCAPSFSSLPTRPRSSSDIPVAPATNDDDEDNDDDDDSYLYSTHDDKPLPWKNLLEYPARASWRVTSTLAAPPTGPVSRRPVLQRIYHDRIVRPHQALINAREADRRRAWQGKAASEQTPRPLLPYGREETWAYAYFRLRANQAIVTRVLHEVRALTESSPRRVLDFGMGCGSATLAALDVWGHDTMEWIHGIEPSQTMRQAALHFLQEDNDDTKPNKQQQRVTFSSHLSAENTTSGGFDLALCCYALQEIPYGSATLAAAALLWEKLQVNGVLVFVEPGTPDGFASLRSVRNFLLAANEHEEELECRVVAPCTHQGPCPMQRFAAPPKRNHDHTDEDEESDSDSDNDETVDTKKGYCSFVQSLPPSHGRSRKEKFCYLVVQKRVAVQNPEQPSRLTQLLSQTQTSADKLRADTSVVLEQDEESHKELLSAAVDLEDEYLSLDNPDDLGLELVRESPESFGRIVHAPRKKKGHVLVECCTAPGRVARFKVRKSHSKTVPGIYHAARRSRWGGLWPNVKEFEG